MTGRAGASLPASPAAIARVVADIHAASWKVAYRGLFPDHYLDHEISAERRHYWGNRVLQLFAGEGEIFLATIAGRTAGFLCIEVGEEREWGAYVDNLHVLPHLRGANIGGALLARGAAWARAHGQRQLYLWVFERNRAARRFYLRHGWRVAQRRLDAIPGGGRRMVLRMVKPL